MQCRSFSRHTNRQLQLTHGVDRSQVFTRESLTQMELDSGKALANGAMVLPTKVAGKMASDGDKAHSEGLTATFTKANGSMTSEKAQAE